MGNDIKTPVPRGGRCFFRAAIDSILTGRKLVKGTYEYQYPGDTAHFWTEDASGKIVDPTAGQYRAGGKYFRETEVDPLKNIGAITSDPAWLGLSKEKRVKVLARAAIIKKLSSWIVAESFDEALWKAGVDDGAFAGLRDKDAAWYTLEVGGMKVALAVAAPGPGDLVNVAYYVAPDFRNKGYGTKLARYIADRHEKASFLVKKDNEASVKVALSALRGKFAATVGRHVVRLTKEAKPLSGGLAEKEGKKPSDFDPKLVEEGRKVEMEHTDDPAMAKRIATDHLTEDKDYYKKLKKIEKKAIDPVMLGLGAAATALTTAITAKQIKSQMALTEAVQKTQAAKKALIAALAGAGTAGAVGGYALGKKQPKKTEKTTILQPMIVTPDEVPTKAADDRSESIERARRHLRGLVRPFGPLYKTKGAQGWDVLVESILTDAQASGTGK